MRGRTLLVAIALLGAAFVGCIGSADENVDAASTEPATDDTPEAPNYELPNEITGLEPTADIPADGGAGLWIHEGKAYVAAQGDGFYVADVSDPKDPEKLGHLEGVQPRDADILEYPNRTVAALAAGTSGIHLVDVTDPERPELVSTLEMDAPAHNLAVVEGEHKIYNSRSLGDPVDPGIDIVDVTDPAEPTLEKTWTFPDTVNGQPVLTTGCHDVTVYPLHDRAYCAGVTETFILDVSDPMDPNVEGVIANPAINIHHWAQPSQDHDLLIIGDEYGGTQAPACFGAQDTEQPDERTVSAPTGAIWFYDIRQPEQPTPLGWVSPPMETENPRPCTSHFGDLIPDRDKIAVGWYHQGVVLVDFTDPTAPRIVDQAAQDHNVWEAQYTNGHLVTGNIDGGSSILSLTGQDG
jgi:hypothetical protein